MNRITYQVIFLLSVLFLLGNGRGSLSPAFSQPSAGRSSKLALLIGNSKYESSPLANPHNDVTAFAKALEAVGFEVMLFEDCTNRQMDEALEGFWNRLKKVEVGLFYFSGHGMQVSGENYLMPLNYKIEKEIDIKHEAFSAQKVIESMQDAAPKFSIIILDACRNNPFKRGFRSVARGLGKMDTGNLNQVVIAYATDPDRVAMDGQPGENSPYMSHILKNISQPNLPLEKFFKEVRKGVLVETNGKQKPWETSSLTDEFYFVTSDANQQNAGSAVSKPPIPMEEPSPPPSTNNFAGAWKKAVIQDKDGYTNIRSGANKASSVVGKIMQNEVFEAQPSKGDWWRVKTNDGISGYMHKSRVQLVD